MCPGVVVVVVVLIVVVVVAVDDGLHASVKGRRRSNSRMLVPAPVPNIFHILKLFISKESCTL